MRYGRRFCPCGRCGSVHIRMWRSSAGYVCSCKECGKESPTRPTMREAYRSWQEHIHLN